MTRSGLHLAPLLWVLLPLPASSQEAERRGMLERAGPSVVAIRNVEAYGSGILLDEKGTILTNAHVIVSPLPLRVEAQFKENGKLQTRSFRKVTLIGVHPSRDLAIIRIDPSEHRAQFAPLPLSTHKIVTHDLVLAIGFPSTYGGTQKICTSGEVTGVDRFVDMPGYFEFSAEVHPGNSGGPIVDTFGNGVGVVTAGQRDGKRVAWAIPLFDFRPDQFVPLDQRPKDPAKASKLLRFAEEELKEAKGGSFWSGLLSAELYLMALVEDISNPDTYFKIGMIHRHYDKYPEAAAYLMRSIQLEPWNGSKAEVYHELGMALINLKKTTEATTVWEEGLAKFPGEAGRIWDDLANYHFENGRYYEAACASRASLRVFGPRAQAMNDIYDRARKRLDVEVLGKLSGYERSLDGQIRQAHQVSEDSRRDGKRFIHPECESLITSYEGVQKEASNFNFSSLGQGPNAPPPITIPQDQLLPIFIQTRIAVAAEHLHNGKIDLATQVLEDVIKTYPNHPETEAARDLLGLIKKRK